MHMRMQRLYQMVDLCISGTSRCLGKHYRMQYFSFPIPDNFNICEFEIISSIFKGQVVPAIINVDVVAAKLIPYSIIH